MRTHRQSKDRRRILEFCDEQGWDVTCRRSKSGYTLLRDGERMVRLRFEAGGFAYSVAIWDGDWQPLSEPGRPMPLAAALEIIAENMGDELGQPYDEELVEEEFDGGDTLESHLSPEMLTVLISPETAGKMLADCFFLMCVAGILGLLVGQIGYAVLAGLGATVAFAIWKQRLFQSKWMGFLFFLVSAAHGLIPSVVCAQFTAWYGHGWWPQIGGWFLAFVVAVVLFLPLGCLVAGFGGGCVANAVATWLGLNDFWNGVAVAGAAWTAAWLYFRYWKFVVNPLLKRFGEGSKAGSR